ncbi:MAG: apolipoprotein N-acyltransferase [Spirochaetales bacterium]|nr:apolipoprotein N-acyltransferase [Spirochaetales bacterium]
MIQRTGNMFKPLDQFFYRKKNWALFLVLLSSVAYPLSIPNEIFKYGNPLLGFIAFIPVFMALSISPTRKYSAFLGAIFGLISSLLAYYWLKNFGNYSFYTLGGVTFAYVLFKAWLFTVLHAFTRFSPRYRPFLLAIGWGFYEYLKSVGFLGFPWALMPHSIHQILPLVQLADITGIWGLSFLMALANAIGAEIMLQLPYLKNQTRRLFLSRQVLVMVAYFFLAMLYGFIRLGIDIPVIKTADMVLVQQNRDPWRPDALNESLLDAMDLSETGINAKPQKPDLVAWNETAFNWFIEGFRNQPEERPFFGFLKEMDTFFLVGAPAYKKNTRDVMNSTLLMNPQGEVLDLYGKIHPVPLAESNPLWDIPAVKKFFQEVVGVYGVWTTGDEYTVFEIPLRQGGVLKFSTPICFEDSFHDLLRQYIIRGADLWINMTNVSWSQTDSAEIQMFVSAKFKAIENRRTLVRSTNAGVTAIIDPWGKTLASLPLFEKGYLRYNVPVYKENHYTAYTLLGDYFPFLMGLFVLVYITIFGIKGYSKPLQLAKQELSDQIFYSGETLENFLPEKGYYIEPVNEETENNIQPLSSKTENTDTQ